MPAPSYLPYGLSCGHTWHECGALLEFTRRRRIGLFVEIGVHEGGLGSLIVPSLAYDAALHYFGVEVDRNIVRAEFKAVVTAFGGRANLLYLDCFTAAAKDAVRAAMMAAPLPAFLYCDGGDKRRELKEYGLLARAGDYLGVHDFWWGPGHEIEGLPGYGIDPAIWKPEVTPADLHPTWPLVEPELFARTRTLVYERPA